MSHRKTLLAASIVAGLWMSVLHAQDAPPPGQTKTQADAKQATQLGTVTVTGIRASLKQSMDTKRNADAIVEAISAEDIGKFPATNVAEALAQVPGVTLDRSIPATQRVSINGIDPSLNYTQLDGHPVAQALWLFGDNPNRGFNYSLLPPEILGALEVYKSPEARLPEGWLGGLVNMHTIQPLDVAPNTVSGSVGLNYNDMVHSTRPSTSFFYSWHNRDKTFGVDFSAQHFEQFTNRQGEEVFGYSTLGSLASSSPYVQSQLASGRLKSTDLLPQEINAANFEQTEKRDSITVNLQWKPFENFETSLGLMYLRDNLDNLNQSVYSYTTLRPGGIASLTPGPHGIITGGSSIDPNGACANDTAGLCGQKALTFSDNFARQSVVKTKGIDWRSKYHGDGWELSGQFGVSTSHNPMTSALKEFAYGGSYDWSIKKGFDFADPTAYDPNYWSDYGWGGNYSTLNYGSRDLYGQIDFSKDFDGFVNQLLVGVRYASHWENQTEMVYTGGPAQTLAEVGFGGLSSLRGLSRLGLGYDMAHLAQTADAEAIRAAKLPIAGNPAYADAVSFWNNTWAVQQKNEAAYAQANFGNDNLHGNLGVRFVRTEFTSSGYNVPGDCIARDSWDCAFPSGFGYVTRKSSRNDVLPALNIAYNITPDLIVRGAASEAVAYAPYNQLAPYFEANDNVLTGAAGNPNLKPYRAVNFDGSLEWYFDSQSVLAASVFYKHILNYVINQATTQVRQNGSWAIPGFAQTAQALVDAGLCTTGGVCKYGVTAPVDGGMAKVKGFALSYQQAFGDSGFGLRANYTYSDASTSSGGGLPYNSKHSVNLVPYFEQGPYSASLSYGWRSHYLAGGYVAGAPNTSIDDYRELDATLGYQIDRNFSLTFNALNLLDETYFAYLGSKTQLATKYKTGRQYLFGVHFKF